MDAVVNTHDGMKPLKILTSDVQCLTEKVIEMYSLVVNFTRVTTIPTSSFETYEYHSLLKRDWWSHHNAEPQ